MSSDEAAAPRRMAELLASRARIAAAADADRRRLHAELHDGAQQRLVHAVIALKLVSSASDLGPAASALVDEALINVERASSELRELVRTILPSSLMYGGLRTGLESLADDLVLPTEVRVETPRLSPAVETTAYFVVAETLAHAVEHAQARHAEVDVSLGDGSLVIEVRHDGSDAADAGMDPALTGLWDRVDTAAGWLTISSSSGSGTTLRAELPAHPGRGFKPQQKPPTSSSTGGAMVAGFPASAASQSDVAAEQAALLRVAALVAQGADEQVIFGAVAREAASLCWDEPTTLVRYEGKRTFTVLATRNGPARPGTTITVPTGDRGVLDEMLQTRQPARRDRRDAIADRSSSNRSSSNRSFGVGASVSVPIFVQGRLWGALGVLDEGRRLPTETEGRLAKFSELVGSALANVEARAELQRFGEEQAALRRVAELAANGVSPTSVLRAVVVEACLLFDEAVVSLGQRDSSGTWHRIEAAAGAVGSPVPPISPEEAIAGRDVLAAGQPVRIDDHDSSYGTRREGGTLWCSGVPVRVEGVTWAALVATAGPRPLPSGTEDRLAQFAQLAAAAVTAARSRDTVNRLARDQAALRRVAELIAGGAPLDEAFAAIATEASDMLGGTTTGLYRYDVDGVATLVARARCSAPVGLRLPVQPAAVQRVEGPVRFPTLVDTPYAALVPYFGDGEVVAVPINIEGQFWGGFSTTTRGGRLSAEAVGRLFEFAELAAAAVANAENKAKLRASRARLVATADETRQRLQRDVHDGAQQRLVQTVLTLKLALDTSARGKDPVELVREALENAERATVELRDLVHGILPASLSRGGLRTGIESLIAGLGIRVELDTTGLPEQRLPTDLEVTAYFIVAEALTNVVKHAGATGAHVVVSAAAGVLELVVADDGHGGADPRGTGLTGLGDRVDAMNGTLTLMSGLGQGTTVRVTLPCA